MIGVYKRNNFEANKKTLDITSTTPSAYVTNMENLCKCALDIISLVFEHYSGKSNPITITSGYRSQEKNKEVGGVDKSQHLEGQAVDMQISGGKTKDGYSNLFLYYIILKLLKMEIIGANQIIYECRSTEQAAWGIYPDWVHYGDVHNGKKASTKSISIKYYHNGKYSTKEFDEALRMAYKYNDKAKEVDATFADVVKELLKK